MIRRDMEFLDFCKTQVAKYTNAHTDATDHADPITEEDVFVVWYAKTLQNWKGLFSTTRFDGMYYEVTVNGDKEEAYLDAYKKVSNEVIKI